MSIDMYLSESQAQAASASTMAQEEIAAYEQLEVFLEAFEGSADKLKGKAYDSARLYSERVLRPLVLGGKLLSQAIGEAVKRFPEAYVEQVSDESLKESDLMEDIQRLTIVISNAQSVEETLLQDTEIPGAAERALQFQKMIDIAGEAKKLLQDKLDKLRAFDASSPQIFSEIDALKDLVNTGISQLGSGWDARNGVYVLPADLSWAVTLDKKKNPLKILTSEEQEYVNNLMEQYGFDETTALQILQLKKGLDEKFPDMSQAEKDYLLNRILGAPVYNGFNWENTAGDLYTYFKKLHIGNGNNVYYESMSILEIYQELGLTEAEAKQLNYNIRLQNQAVSSSLPKSTSDMSQDDYDNYKKAMEAVYGPLSDQEFSQKWSQKMGTDQTRGDDNPYNDGFQTKTDFAHQSITTATHLNPHWALGSILFGGKDGLAEVSGWRGDVTQDAEANPSMGNDDYKADLDAVNITNIMKEKNMSFTAATNYYYSQLNVNSDSDTAQTRSEQFLHNVNIEHVKDEIYDLVPPKIIIVVGQTYTEERTVEEKRDYLKEHYPDSYNFLRSLENGDNDLGNYAESE